MTQAQHDIALMLAEARLEVLRGNEDGEMTHAEWLRVLSRVGDVAQAAGNEATAALRAEAVKARG